MGRQRAGGTAYGKQTLHRGGIWYTAQSGIWQTVWLERVPENYLETVRVTPSCDEAGVRFEPVFGPGCAPLPLEVTVMAEGRAVAAGSAAPGEALTLALPGFHSWSPEDPFLYRFAGPDGGGPRRGVFRAAERRHRPG